LGDKDEKSNSRPVWAKNYETLHLNKKFGYPNYAGGINRRIE
jgi:hypothetical protein